MAGYANTGQFDLARKRAEQRSNTEQQQQEDALKRRFSAMGNLNSGAYVKQQAVQADTASQRKADVMEGIDVAEAGEAQRQREVLEGRQFQTSERLGSQDFSNLQRLGSQDFARGERLGSQDFGASQADLQRRFQTSERLGSQSFASGEREASQSWQGGQNDLNRGLQQQQISNQASQWQQQFEASNSQWTQQFNAQVDQWAKQYGLEKDAQDFNTYLAVMEHNSDLFAPKISMSGSFNSGGKYTSWETF
jgi:predicted transcriptional regulator